MFLYGASGDGKSSLINAGLLPAVSRRRLRPERIRVQPRLGEEIVVERIARTEDDGDRLPSLLVSGGDEASRVVLSAQAFEDRVRAVCAEGQRPLLIFDQFEEVITLFEERGASDAQRHVAEMLVRLLHDPLAVKLLFVFREDYLSKVKRLLAAAPELVDQALHLEPLSAEKLPTIIRGPFDRFPGHFERELDAELAERLCTALVDRFGAAELSLSEVETVALRLWQSDDPAALLAERGVQGLLEDYLGESLDDLRPDVRAAAIALLAQMVTSAGTRNVISGEDLTQRVREDDPSLSPTLLAGALERLEVGSRLIRRERRRETYLYEITSEFLVPWISRRRDELAREQERAQARRRYVLLGSVAGALLVVVAIIAVIAVWALGQRAAAQREASTSRSFGLAAAATSLTGSRPDVALLLGLAAYGEAPLPEARGATIAALIAARVPDLRAILHGHTGGVNAVAFDRDGSTIASASDDGTIRLWNARTHRPLGRPLAGGPGQVLSVAFAPDGRSLASAGAGGMIRIWDPRTGRQLGAPLRGHTGMVFGVAFDPTGLMLASAGDDGTVRLWSARTHKQIGAPISHGPDPVNAVQFSPNGRMLASADDRVVRLADPRTGKQLGAPLDAHGDELAFSSDGRMLATAGAGPSVRFWSTRTHRQVGAPLNVDAPAVNGLAFSPDGRTLAVAIHHGTIQLWSPRTRRERREVLEAGTREVNAVTFGPDGRTLASADDDDTVRIWEPGARLWFGAPLAGNREQVNGVAFSSDGRTLASGGDDGTVRVWDLRTRKQLGRPLSVRPALALGIAFSPDGRTLAAAEGFGASAIRLWDASSHRQLGALLDTPSSGGVRGLAFSPEGATLASAGVDGTIHLWDVRTHKPLGAPLPSDGAGLNGVAFSPNGAMLASAGDDGAIHLWDPRTDTQLGAPLRGHVGSVFGVAFSPGGDTLASAGFDGTVRLWDLKTHRQLGTPLVGHVSSVYGVGFSPDGETIASAGIDGTVRLWDRRTHKPLGTPLKGVQGAVDAVAFSPDGRSLASANDDHTVRIWDNLLWRSEAELQDDVCDLVGAGLTHNEWTQFAGSVSYRSTCP